jgi:hypothetical protein
MLSNDNKRFVRIIVYYNKHLFIYNVYYNKRKIIINVVYNKHYLYLCVIKRISKWTKFILNIKRH